MLNQRQLVRGLGAAGLVLFLAAVPRAAADTFPWQRYLEYPGVWYEGFEARRIGGHVLTHQSPQGGWPKNIDTGAKPYEGDPNALRPSFESGATLGEMRFLARLYQSNKDNRYTTAFGKGLKFILDSQYASGAWPLNYPLPKTRTIAFSDGTMLQIMQFLREVAEGQAFPFVRRDTREQAKKAFDRGIECLVKCQLVVDDDLAGWCARYDEKTLEPRKGKAADPLALCTPESGSILLFLMTLDDPDVATLRAIHGGCAWFELVKLAGIKLERRKGDVAVVRDPEAPLLWARFYEIGKNRAVFTRRDGSVRYKLSDLEVDRRNELNWYAPWGQIVLGRYEVWRDQ